MYAWFSSIVTNFLAMWLKICYVLKDNKDKLLGYIHIPTKQENFNEEIRWVQARQNGKKEKRVRLITNEIELEGKDCPPPTEEDNFIFESGKALTYEEIDNVSAAKIVEQDFADIDCNDGIPSPTGSDDGNDDDEAPVSSAQDFSVEIRYEPRTEAEQRSDGIRTPSPIEEEVPDERCEPPLDREIDEDTRAQLEQISFDNKIRFIYSRRDDGKEEILTIPSRQEDFNRGIRHPSSSPKKDKVLKKASSSQKLSSTRNDATFTVPTNSNDLKEIIYHQWLEKKKVQTKEEIKAKMLAQKRAAKQAEADANERKVTAQKIYDAWNDSKTDKIITEKEMTKKAKQAEKEKIEEALQRKKDAEKYFEAWKREKDEKIKKMIVQKKKEEKQKDKEQFNLKRQTSEEALKAFESWKIQKAKEIAEMKKKEEEEKAKAGEEKVLAFEKKQEALRVYEQWKSVKKSPRAQSQSPQLMQSGRNKGTIDVTITKLTNQKSPKSDTTSPNQKSPKSNTFRFAARSVKSSSVSPEAKSMSPKPMSVKCEARSPRKTINDTEMKTIASFATSSNNRYRKPNTEVDPKTKKPVAVSDPKVWKQKVASVAKIRKPITNPKAKNRKTEMATKLVETVIEKKSWWSPFSWTFYHFFLWKILACIAIVYYAEQLLEQLVFKGTDPCLKMAAKCLTTFADSVARCLTGFAESIATLRNDTLNRRPGITTCIPTAIYDLWNCTVFNRR